MAEPSNEHIDSRIFLIRGRKITFSFVLAELYGVEHRALLQAGKRNANRFPDDFMFRPLDRDRAENRLRKWLLSQEQQHLGDYEQTRRRKMDLS